MSGVSKKTHYSVLERRVRLEATSFSSSHPNGNRPDPRRSIGFRFRVSFGSFSPFDIATGLMSFGFSEAS